jgi:hypothetical protein
MKLFLLLIVVSVSLVTASSCTKDITTVVYDTTTNYSTPYYVRATVNGTNVVYKNFTQVTSLSPGYLEIYGYNSDAVTTSDGIDIIIYYQVNNHSGNDTAQAVVGTYTDTSGYLAPRYTAAMGLRQAGLDYVNIVSIDDTSSDPLTCILTTFNSTYVSGTFSGTLYYGVTPTSASKVITNGSFYVPF